MQGSFEIGYLWVFLLTPVPLLATWLLPPFRQRREALRFPAFRQAEDSSGIKGSSGAWISRRHALQWLLMVLSWLLFLGALSSPRLVGEPEMKVKTARSFVIAADVSFSMAARDWTLDGDRVTRWEGVKQIMREFIHQREGDRMALVFFGTNAYLQVPLTTDLEVMDYMLDETDVGMAGQMTSIGKAIGYSLDLFKGDSLEQKVLLLLTDGQDDGRGLFPTDAARMAGKDSITIYTIGIGEPTGNNAGLDEKSLEQIAEITGGRYFLAQDEAQLEEAYRTLNELEPMEFEQEEHAPVTLLYHYPLGAALCLAYLLSLMRGILKILKG